MTRSDWVLIVFVVGALLFHGWLDRQKTDDFVHALGAIREVYRAHTVAVLALGVGIENAERACRESEK